MPKDTKASEEKKTRRTSKKASTPKKEVAKTTTSKKKVAIEKKVTKKAKENETVTSKKVASKKSTKKDNSKTTKKVSKTTPKKNVSSKAKTISRKKSSLAKDNKIMSLEYYDLPYRYNQTVVRILAQTPTTLFVYWDISDSDREKFIKDFGDNFFNETSPVLIVHNKTMNYSFEIEVNDFANSWYFNVADAKCDYEIEFGRRKKSFTNVSIPNDYIYIASSNVIEAPNNRILFEPNTKTLFFRNVKTNQTFSKDVSTFSFMEKLSRIYNIYDIYKQIYREEEILDITNNPTSSGSSSVFYTKKN